MEYHRSLGAMGTNTALAPFLQIQMNLSFLPEPLKHVFLRLTASDNNSKSASKQIDRDAGW